jgi:surface protein
VPQIGKNVSIQMANPNCIEVVNAVARETEYTTVQVTGKPVEADCFSDIIIRDDLGVAKSVMIRVNVHPLVDDNHNYMIDEFDLKDGAECKKDSDCDSGFCDSFIGYRCSYRCMADDQCISDKYFCRPDGRCAPKVFETVWNVRGSYLNFPIDKATACNFTIDWGDGAKETVTSCPNTTFQHEYANTGEYHVKVTGTLDGWAMHDVGYSCSGNVIGSLERIESFGPVGLGAGAFSNATEFKKMSPVDIPDATKLTSTRGMFCRSEIKTNGWYYINNWDMSNVKDMSFMFYRNNTFNQEIGSWNTGNVKDMSYMFSEAKLFNQDIGSWDTSNVENMSYMFKDAIAFNQDIGKWDMSNVENLSYMFQDASEFNQNIGSWDLSNAENMSYMFYDAQKFNQDIGKWNVSNVEDMGSMFERAKAFNQDIGGWDVSNVRDMRDMFEYAAAFNQNLSGWKLSSSPNTSYMFNGSGLSKENYCAMKTAEGTWWKGSYSTYGLPKTYDPCP